MSFSLSVGGSQSGGTATTLTDTGTQEAGSRQFFLPTSTRLAPRLVKYRSNIQPSSSTKPGSARAGVQLILGNVVDPETGCCTVKAGNVIVDVTIRWPLDQPGTLVDEALDLLQGVAFSTQLSDAIKLGVLPT